MSPSQESHIAPTDPSAMTNHLAPAVIVEGESIPHWTLTERMAYYKIPGVSLAILKDFEIVWAKGFGVCERGTDLAVTPETMFQAASISKPVAGTGALRLVEQGDLRLDVPVNTYLKSWQLPENEFTRERPVTLRHLLSHTGGLTVHGFMGYPAGEPLPTIPQILDGQSPANSAPVRVDIPVGSRFRYSGGGFTILQLLIEDLTGLPFDQVLAEKVLIPAGMLNSRYEQPLSDQSATRAASGHLGNGDLLPGKRHTYPERAAAGLWTTPSDLLRLAGEHQKSLRDGSGKVLSKAMTAQMLTPQVKVSELGLSGAIGLGFFLSPADMPRFFSHGGSNEGFRCQLTASLDGRFGAAVMTNGDNGSFLIGEIMQSIAATMGWPDSKPAIRKGLDLDQAAMMEYTGRFDLDERNFFTISLVNDRLILQIPGSIGLGLIPTGVDHFFTREGNYDLSFARDENGAVSRLDLLGNSAIKVKEEAG